jgi:ribokinase
VKVMQKPIVVVGSINLDLVAEAKRLPVPGETLLGKNFETFHGGKGANQAVAVAKLGYPVIFIGCVGSDRFANELGEGLVEAGVEIQFVKTVPGSSGVAVILRAESGENSIVVVPGANSRLLPEDLKKHKSVLSGAGMILTQLETPLETVEYLAELCQETGVPLMLDPAPAVSLNNELLRGVAWLTPNETEAAALLAWRGGVVDPPSVASALLVRRVRNVVLKLGERGVYIEGQDIAGQYAPAFRVTAVDTTAAGDVFNAAFAVALMRNKAPEEAARFACAAAAISVTRPGAQPSVPTAKEVSAFLEGAVDGPR